MSLTVRQDGSQVGGQPNTVYAAWWNDYHDLLTGAMTDQDIAPKTDLILAPIGASPGVPTAALTTGTALGIGAYQYKVTFVKHGESGETAPSSSVSITTTSGNQSVVLSAIATGPSGTIARNLYRTAVGGSTYYLLATISDNTTTSYTDTTADASLSTTTAPTHTSFGGRLILKNNSGTNTAIIYANGSVYFDAGAFTSDGAGNVTLGGSLTFGSPVGSSRANLSYISAANAVQLMPPESAGSVAQGLIFQSWDGSAFHNLLSIGGQFGSALDWIGNDGVLTFGAYDSALGTVRTIRIFLGTTDPSTYTTVNEGDIWMDG